MAQQLVAQQETVSALILLDPPTEKPRLLARRGERRDPEAVIREKASVPGESNATVPFKHAFLRAYNQYRARPYSGPAVFISSDENSRRILAGDSWWNQILGKGAKGFLLQGVRHQNLFRDELPMLVEVINRTLEGA